MMASNYSRFPSVSSFSPIFFVHLSSLSSRNQCLSNESNHRHFHGCTNVNPFKKPQFFSYGPSKLSDKLWKFVKRTFEIGTPNKKSSYTWAIPSLLYPILSWKTLAFWPGLASRRLANGSHRHLGLYPDDSTRAAQIHWFWSSDALSTGRLQTFGVLKGAKCCLLHHIVVVAFLGGHPEAQLASCLLVYSGPLDL